MIEDVIEEFKTLNTDDNKLTFDEQDILLLQIINSIYQLNGTLLMISKQLKQMKEK